MLYVQFYILHGLPGSGKSAWAEKFKQEQANTTVITLDGFSTIDTKLKTCLALVEDAIDNSSESKNLNIVIDGLFLSNQALQKLISTIESVVQIKCPHSYHIKSWEPDQTLCMKNCLSHLTREAAMLIRDVSVEEPDIALITDCASVSLYIDLENLLVESEVEEKMLAAESVLLNKFDKLFDWYSQHVDIECVPEKNLVRFSDRNSFLDFLLYVDRETTLMTADFANIFSWYVVSDEEDFIVDIVGLTEYLVQRNIINVSTREET